MPDASFYRGKVRHLREVRLPRLERVAFMPRLRAWYVDNFIVFFLHFSMAGAFFADAWGVQARLGPWQLVYMYLVSWLYRGILGSRIGHGQTLGKYNEHLRLVDQRGRDLPLFESLVRAGVTSFAYLAWAMIPIHLHLFGFLLVTVCSMLIDLPRWRTIADMLVETQVVVLHEGRRPSPSHNRLALGILCLVGVGVYRDVAFALSAPAPSGRPKLVRREPKGGISPQVPNSPSPILSPTYDVAGLGIDALMARAQAGDVPAQTELGERFSDGRGVPKDIAQAERWLKAAAERGNARAQFELSGVYFQAGPRRNIPEGLRLLKEAARQKYRPALIAAAMMNIQGILKSDEPEMGIRILTEQANSGDRQAQYILGRLRLDGAYGVKRDDLEARKRLEQSAKLGFPPAMDFLRKAAVPN